MVLLIKSSIVIKFIHLNPKKDSPTFVKIGLNFDNLYCIRVIFYPQPLHLITLIKILKKIKSDLYASLKLNKMCLSLYASFKTIYILTQ